MRAQCVQHAHGSRAPQARLEQMEATCSRISSAAGKVGTDGGNMRAQCVQHAHGSRAPQARLEQMEATCERNACNMLMDLERRRRSWSRWRQHAHGFRAPQARLEQMAATCSRIFERRRQAWSRWGQHASAMRATCSWILSAAGKVGAGGNMRAQCVQHAHGFRAPQARLGQMEATCERNACNMLMDLERRRRGWSRWRQHAHGFECRRRGWSKWR
jgi:hypothetical protein